jgi:hypothetical protein
MQEQRNRWQLSYCEVVGRAKQPEASKETDEARGGGHGRRGGSTRDARWRNNASGPGSNPACVVETWQAYIYMHGPENGSTNLFLFSPRLLQRVGEEVDAGVLISCVFAGATEERDGGAVRAGCQGDVRGDQGQVTAPCPRERECVGFAPEKERMQIALEPIMEVFRNQNRPLSLSLTRTNHGGI